MPTATLVRPEPALGPVVSPFIAAAQLPDPFTLVIFGANGDLERSEAHAGDLRSVASPVLARAVRRCRLGQA